MRLRTALESFNDTVPSSSSLCQSAWAAAYTKDSHLSALYRRVKSRRGEQKAIMAVAHQLLTIIFHVIRDGSVYKELGGSHYDRQNKSKVTRKLVDRLQKLGYYVTLQPIPTTPAAEPEPAPPSTSEIAAPARRRRGRPCKCAERDLACKHGRVQATDIKSAEIRGQAGGVLTLND